MVDGCTPHLAGNHCLAQAMVMKAGDLVSLSFGQLLVSHGVPLCFFGEKKRTRTGSWPLLSYAPWVLQLLSEFALWLLNLSMKLYLISLLF